MINPVSIDELNLKLDELFHGLAIALNEILAEPKVPQLVSIIFNRNMLVVHFLPGVRIGSLKNMAYLYIIKFGLDLVF